MFPIEHFKPTWRHADLPLVQVESQNRRATPVKVVATMALVALSVALVLNYRYETRDEYARFAVRWSHFQTSEDGRTLTFTGVGDGDCDEPDGVELEGDDPVVATVYYRKLVVRDGNPIYCTLGLGPGLDVPITLDAPLPPGTLVVDGTLSLPTSRENCPQSQQRVGDTPDTGFVYERLMNCAHKAMPSPND